MADAATGLGDVQVPSVGFGTYLISDEHARPAVAEALRAGYRHIDTAEGYGNEEGVGTAIREFLGRERLDRDEVFVTTKLWPGREALGEEPKDDRTTIDALEASLRRLQLDHVDLYLIHAPFDPEQRLAQWHGLVELRARGLARTIGVSNFGRAHIEAIEAAGMPTPSANQIELHPWSQKPELVAFLRERSILPIAYSSLAPLATWRAAEGHGSAKTEAMRAEGRSPGFAFGPMAEKYGVTEAQVLLRWGIQNGYAVLPKSTDPGRIRQNLDLFSFVIDDDDMAAIEQMDRDAALAWPIGDLTKWP